MTWTVSYSGTTTPTVSNDTQIGSDDSTNATYQVLIDTTNLVNGETLEIRLWTKVLSGSTLNVVWKGSVTGPQAAIVKLSPPVPSDQVFRATIKQVNGTARAYDWKIMRI